MEILLLYLSPLLQSLHLLLTLPLCPRPFPVTETLCNPQGPATFTLNNSFRLLLVLRAKLNLPINNLPHSFANGCLRIWSLTIVFNLRAKTFSSQVRSLPNFAKKTSVSTRSRSTSFAYVGLHRLPFVTRCDRGCLMFTGLY